MRPSRGRAAPIRNNKRIKFAENSQIPNSYLDVKGLILPLSRAIFVLSTKNKDEQATMESNVAAGFEGMPRLLRCYAENKGQGWEAICLDLDIAVQADSFEEAFRELREAVEVYAETVAELPEADRKRLFNRRAPLSLRVTFFLHALYSIFRDDDKERANFTCHCPA